MDHVLVVANQTVSSDELVAAVLVRNARGPCHFTVVVPATPLSNQELALRHSEHPGAVAYESGPVAIARMRLAKAMDRLAEASISCSGDIGDPDPFKAVEIALHSHSFDDVIVSTLPRRVSRWLAQDLPHRIARHFDVPVTHVETGEQLGPRERAAHSNGPTFSAPTKR